MPVTTRPTVEYTPSGLFECESTRIRRTTFGSASPCSPNPHSPRRSELLTRKLKQGLITEAEINALYSTDMKAGRMNREVDRQTRRSRKSLTETCFSINWFAWLPGRRQPNRSTSSPEKRASITTLCRQSLEADCQNFVCKLKLAHEDAKQFSAQETRSRNIFPTGVSLEQKQGRRSSFIAWLAAKPSPSGGCRRRSSLIMPALSTACSSLVTATVTGQL